MTARAISNNAPAPTTVAFDTLVRIRIVFPSFLSTSFPVKRISNERFHLILLMERAPISEAAMSQLPLDPGCAGSWRKPSKDLICESGSSLSFMRLSDDEGSGKISRSNETTRMALPGNGNNARCVKEDVDRGRASASFAPTRVLRLATVPEPWLPVYARQVLRCRDPMQSYRFGRLPELSNR